MMNIDNESLASLCLGQEDPLEFETLSDRELEDIKRKLSRDLYHRNIRTPFRLYTAERGQNSRSFKRGEDNED